MATFLPERRRRPHVADAPQDGSDFGYVARAFIYDGAVYIGFDRAEEDAGRIVNTSGRLRTFEVADAVQVDVPSLTDMGDRSGGTATNNAAAQFLQAVQSGIGDSVPVRISFNDQGRITAIREQQTVSG